jgi:hypothetical protein
MDFARRQPQDDVGTAQPGQRSPLNVAPTAQSRPGRPDGTTRRIKLPALRGAAPGGRGPNRSPKAPEVPWATVRARLQPGSPRAARSPAPPSRARADAAIRGAGIRAPPGRRPRRKRRAPRRPVRRPPAALRARRLASGQWPGRWRSGSARDRAPYGRHTGLGAGRSNPGRCRRPERPLDGRHEPIAVSPRAVGLPRPPTPAPTSSLASG